MQIYFKQTRGRVFPFLRNAIEVFDFHLESRKYPICKYSQIVHWTAANSPTHCIAMHRPPLSLSQIQLISDNPQTHWCVRDTPVLRIICAKLRRFYTSTVDRSIHADFREVPTVHIDFSKRPDLIGFNPFDFPSKSSISGILEGIVSSSDLLSTIATRIGSQGSISIVVRPSRI